MKFENEIVPEIKRIVNSDYSSWAIGISNNPALRRKELGNPAIWYEWEVVTSEAAYNVMRYFHSQGVNIDSRSERGANHIYLSVQTGEH